MGLGDELLLWSLIEDNEKHLRTALEYGANVNLTSPTGSCPLHVAARWDSAWLIKILLDHKATVDQKDESGFTPLMVAALNGNTDAARVLLSMGADPNMKRPSNGETALHLAMNSKSRTMVGTLLDADADINAQTSDRKFTPLHLAAWFNAGDLVSLLLEDSLCDATILDGAGRTAAMVATEKSNLHVAEHLRLFAMTKSVEDKELLSAVMELDNKAAKKALIRGANANLCFHVAAKEGSVNLIKILLHHKANVNEIDSLGFTPLMVAALNGKTDAAKVLLSMGADPNMKRPSNGETALHLAMNSKSRTMVGALLNAGADINAQTSDKKFTPLHLAAWFNARDLVSLLLEDSLCDATILDGAGRTAAMVATEKSNLHVAEHLRLFAMTKSVEDKELLSAVMELDKKAAKKALIRGANANLCFHVAAKKGSVPLIKILLYHQANVNEIDSLGFTPLMVAALNGNTDAVKELLLNGAKVNQKSIDNETALHLAMKGGSHGVVNELLEKGADINAQTISKKFTPLHFAVHFNDQYLRKVLKMRTECDATIVDWKGRTADQLAEESGHQHGTLPDTPDGNMIKLEGVSENVYKASSPPRGKVLVFNYEKFEKKEDYRKGAVWDSKKVEKLFDKMGYQVNSYHNKKHQETIDILNSFRRSEEMVKVDCVVVCVLSHGIRHDTFVTSDNKSMTVDEIHSYFTDDKCPHLKGKPKLFLFNYCRVDTNSQDDLTTQGNGENPPASETLQDHITIYSTIKGDYAFRNEWKGTHFTEAMTKMFSQYADVLHVAQLAVKMHEYMKMINGPEISVVDETKKKFYLKLPRYK